MRNASNEVDCQIAEKVLGAVWEERGEGRQTLYLNGKAIATRFPTGEITRAISSDGVYLPYYSDLIQDAWALIAHFDEQTTDFSLEKSGLMWTASNVMCQGMSMSPALALCKWAFAMAALKAKTA